MILTGSLRDTFTKRLQLRTGYNLARRWLNLRYLPVSAMSLGIGPPHGCLWAIYLCHLLTARLRNHLFCCHKTTPGSTLRPGFRCRSAQEWVPGIKSRNEAFCQIKGSTSVTSVIALTLANDENNWLARVYLIPRGVRPATMIGASTAIESFKVKLGRKACWRARGRPSQLISEKKTRLRPPGAH